ncbi:tetratricopeptide repeat protein [Aureliella helgolandensis]|uniref:Malonyl-[acyl-carrier protein] O-methyltransferase n=1 Tax=Aureliella helgolandensis TaxID=2527968 RepID=A0A518G8M1_9BACT|nr:tetratricopeptide repeat protein [Aureliella helgolandensis]QDV24938.1 Malonyl-[acyl-carrier protein] O-methyltransferase [Aureliella helgolandensis]
MTKLTAIQQLLNEQQHEQAILLLREAITQDNTFAEAWHLLGIAHAQMGQLADAQSSFANAAKNAPDNSLYFYNLALAQRGMGELDGAVESYQRAIELREDFLGARNNLANAYLELGQTDEALVCFQSLVERFPDSSDARFNLANTLLSLRRTDDAVEHYREAIRLAPDQSAARENLGRALTDVQRLDEAREVWEEWLAHAPGDPFARHMLAASTGEFIPERCVDEYVRQEFNVDFAKSFEDRMQRLDYQSPSLIQEALDSLGLQSPQAETLDAGCGTGICAPILRPMSNRLTGVDLSPAMLKEAVQRGVYDELVEGEIVRYMNEQAGRFDLLVSCDTLCYFGQLESVLTASRRALRPGGVLVFTVETSVEAESTDYRLQYHGRYSHSESYVRSVLEAVGFARVHASTAVQRRELGAPVEGLVVSALSPHDA